MGEVCNGRLAPARQPKRVVVLLFSLYLGTAPVYWFWNIPTDIVAYAKYTLFGSALLVAWAASVFNNAGYLPRAVAGPGGLLAFSLAMAPGLVQSDWHSELGVIVDLVTCFVMLWSVHLIVRNGVSIVRIWRWSVFIILPFALLVIATDIVPQLQWPSPFLAGVTLADTGFGGVRTGWSLGLALFLPPALMVADLVGARRPVAGMMLSALFIITILGSQLTVAGRGGLVGSMVAISVWLWFGKASRWLWVVPAVGIIILSMDMEWLWQTLRLDRMQEFRGIESLDHFSASRIGQYVMAAQLIAGNPIFGHGFAYVDYSTGLSAASIHNVWLKLGVQTGIAAPSLLLAVAWTAARRAHRIAGRGTTLEQRVAGPAVLGIIAAGVAVSMFEPNALIGTFQNSAMWWVAVGAATGLSAQRGANAQSCRFNPAVSAQWHH